MTDPTIPQQPAVPPTGQPVPPPPAAAPQPPAPPQAPVPPQAPAAPPAYQAPPAQPQYQAPPAQPAGNPYQAAPGQPNAYQQPAAAGAPAAPLTEAEDKQWAMFAHFGGIIGLLPSLIIFLVFKDRGPRTRVEAKEALNWQITWIAATIVLAIVFGIIQGIMFATVSSFDALAVVSVVAGLLSFLTWVPWLLNVIFSIVGGVKVNGGGSYRYPFAIRLIK